LVIVIVIAVLVGTHGTSAPVSAKSSVAAHVTIGGVVRATGRTDLTTSPLRTTEPSELLVAMVSTEYEQSIAVAGGGLSWTQVAQYAGTAMTAGENIELWTARAGPPGSLRITSAITGPGPWLQSLTVMAFRDATGLGAIAQGCYSSPATGCSSSSPVPSVPITATRDGSVVVGVGYDYSDYVAKTVAKGQTLDQQAFDTTERATMWVQHAIAGTSAGTPVDLTATASGNDNWAMLVFEVQPVAAGNKLGAQAASPPVTVLPTTAPVPTTVAPPTSAISIPATLPPTTAPPPTSPPSTAPPATSPPTTQPRSQLLLSQPGSGAEDTAQFTVRDSSWQLAWAYNCAGFGDGTGNFIIDVQGYGGASDTSDLGVNQLGPQGSGDEHYYDQGTFNLSINSECSWDIKVYQP
jgi:hypothetical protein